MMVRSLYYPQGERWFVVEGDGYAKTGNIRQAAGKPTPEFTRLAYGLCLDSDAAVLDDGTVVGDPTEAALVVLAAKLGVDAEETRRAYRTSRKFSSTPPTSSWRRSTRFRWTDRTHLIELVKGGPDVVLKRCTTAQTPDGPVPLADKLHDIEEANRGGGWGRGGGREGPESVGLRGPGCSTGSEDESGGRRPDVGTCPTWRSGRDGGHHRPASRGVEGGGVRSAQSAGIEVRMITGDYGGDRLGDRRRTRVGPGRHRRHRTCRDDRDDQLKAALPEPARVRSSGPPQDKLRLARLMQENGDIVAMTGDAVNDAAALKQADIGVAMGSGSEVTKQAGKMILTDDNFGTLVQAIRLGRSIYSKIIAYVRYQMTQLLSLVLLFLTAIASSTSTPASPSPR